MYYIYAYLREKDNRPYYIGKGSGNRAFSKNHNVSVPNDRNQIVFWHQNLEENEAFNLEMFYINMFGRKDIGTGVLYNRTDGGEGPSGLQHSDEYKERLRQQALNNSGNFGGGDNPRLGVTLSEETKQKISKANKGRKPPQSAIDASKARKGIKNEKNSKHLNRLWQDPKYAKHMSDVHKGQVAWNRAKWKLISPSGEEFIVDGMTKKIGEQYGFTAANIRTRGHSKGWKAKKI